MKDSSKFRHSHFFPNKVFPENIVKTLEITVKPKEKLSIS